MAAVQTDGRENASTGRVKEDLVIGIDFGTSHTRVAWSVGADCRGGQVNYITSWPRHERPIDRVPTELAYNDDDDDKEPAWGYQVPADGSSFRWLKLLLLRPGDLGPALGESEFVTRSRQMMDAAGKTVIDVVADYLRLLWAHVMSTVERACRHAGTDMAALPIHVLITVPGVWKGYARQAMEDAARAAGMLDPRRRPGPTKLSLVTEPEAVLLSTFFRPRSGVKPGSVYTFCDAGGAVVELVSYKVESLDPPVVREVVEGSGAICGGIFIDQNFQHMCMGRLGPKRKRLGKVGLREMMRKEWEDGVKPAFTLARGRQEYAVALPAELSSLDDASRAPCIKNGKIHFHRSDIERAFDSVFLDIKELVEEHIQRTAEHGFSVAAIVLAGGLGSSPYLYEYLTTADSLAEMAVHHGSRTEAGGAICQGAVIKGILARHGNQLEPGSVHRPIMDVASVSRASFGIMFGERVDWLLRRGETTSSSKPNRASFTWNYPPGTFDGRWSCTMAHSEDETPASVKALGELSCTLGMAYSDLTELPTSDGILWKALAIEVEIIAAGASVEFALYTQGKTTEQPFGSRRQRVRAPQRSTTAE